MVQFNATELNKMVADAEKSVRDGAYVVVGLGVLGFQRAQVQRRELAKRLGTDGDAFAAQLNETAEKIGGQLTDVGERVFSNLGASREQMVDLARSVDEIVSPTLAQIDQQVAALEERLPASARNVVSSVRTVMAAPEAALRNFVGRD
jgi:hypothetical protein